MLIVNQVSKQLNGFALNNISFRLPKGYIMGIIGANGAGKTTLIKTILDLWHKDSGEIIINGMSMDQEENESIIKNKIGVILSDEMYAQNLTARVVGELYGPLYTKFDQEQYLKYLERFDVAKDKKLKFLSKGTKIKFQLAFALSHEAELFLFDEPEDGLDQDFRHEFMDLLLELIEDGKRSVLMSTHITEDLDRIADYITYMKKGKVLFSGEKDTICNRFLIVRAEEYRIKLLPEKSVLYSEKGEYSSMALVKNSKMYPIDCSYEVEHPKIQDIMYYIEKGGTKNVEDFLA